MTDKPMIFSASMVRALLDGRKTQTRRVWKLPTKGIYERPDMGGWEATTHGGPGVFTFGKNGERIPAPEYIGIWHRTTGTCLCARHQTGDRLWVRETWREMLNTYGAAYAPGYKATCCQPQIYKWCPPLHMPRRFSRLTLIVTDVRVQRVQEITPDDCRAEGHPIEPGRSSDPQVHDDAARDWFMDLWDSTNAKRSGCAWADNPWVCALTFTVHHQNIDQLQREAVA